MRLEHLELDIDLRIRDLWQMLDDEFPELEEYRETVAAFMRAAYGRGYVDSLMEPLRGQLCKEHGYTVPSRKATA